MMKHMIFKFASGDSVIGKIDFDSPVTSDNNIHTLHDPQWIISEANGSMKLRDGMMLSDCDNFNIHMKDVLTWFTPSKSMIGYYEAAVNYSKLMKAQFDYQTNEATEELIDEYKQLQMEMQAKIS